MHCRIADLRNREVINICDGCRLGYVCDVELNTATGCILAIVVPEPCRFLGIFGRGDDIVIPWDRIKRIGDDLIIVDADIQRPGRGRDKKRFI
ncbi:MAG: YlmC/YmxH family sporulation protein [Oscillospiraceae bacterium]|nr:YlmC/YmxH family sporulation protein [Oscillospiraceae bacterium]